MASLSEEQEQFHQARREQLERLRYQARLAERQYQKSDPDNRLVAAELERRWETALRELKQAEEAWEREQQTQATWTQLDAETRQALVEAGQRLPEWWRTDRFSREQKKALLRCLIDKVVVHRTAPDSVHCRVVWKGGETTDADLAVTVGAWSRLSGSQEMEETILKLARQGKTDEEIARHLSTRGHHSPRQATVLRSTVQIVRLRHHVFRNRRQSHPRTNRWIVDGAATHREAEDHKELDLRPYPQRYHSGRSRRRPEALSVPRQPRNPRPVPTAPGGEAQHLTFLGGYQDAVSKYPDKSASTTSVYPVLSSRSTWRTASRALRSGR